MCSQKSPFLASLLALVHIENWLTGWGIQPKMRKMLFCVSDKSVIRCVILSSGSVVFLRSLQSWTAHSLNPSHIDSSHSVENLQWRSAVTFSWLWPFSVFVPPSLCTWWFFFIDRKSLLSGIISFGRASLTSSVWARWCFLFMIILATHSSLSNWRTGPKLFS